MATATSTDEFTGSVSVIDGDTFDVGGTRVRLYGIDAVEGAQECTNKQGATWRCGEWVTSEVRSRYEGKLARCTAMDTDRYGRVVARCDVGGADVGRMLVRDGLAFAFRRYSMDYDLDEKAAVISGAGLHASQVQSPEQYRKTRAAGSSAPVTGCVIKGNISSKGVRIFHSPGQRDYERTGIREDRGERWFCSAGEAEAAGWRAARR
ncbi:MAG: thermonuclease family protein [Roseobacter sp.]|jgi:endonuclease YncB( thermonuclease family)|nr:thermonuclease family protein [Roseobacter sp.]